jgi:hypothetical protein
MRLLRTVVFILALGALLLPGCTPADTVCQPSDLVAPHLTSPSDYAHVTSNTPWLTWELKAVTYPSPGAPAACHPDKYRVSVSTAPMFTDELGSDVTAMAVTGGWTSPALQYGKTYHWNVTAISGGVLGPTSVTRTFSVGSNCTEAQLEAPVLLQPADHSIVHTSRPSFQWDTTMTCLPMGYHLHYREAGVLPAYWADPIVVTDLSGRVDDIGADLKDCANYDWTVFACTDPSDYTHCGWTGGPVSEFWNFTVVLPGTTDCSTGALPPISPTVVLTPTPVPPAPVGEKPWEVTMNANCRVCPSGACNESGFAPKGYLAPIEGRNEDATWFRIKDPRGVSCWIWGGALQVPSDASGLGLLAYPTPPPATEPLVPGFDCASLGDVRSCLAHPGCVYDRVQQVCKNP